MIVGNNTTQQCVSTRTANTIILTIAKCHSQRICHVTEPQKQYQGSFHFKTEYLTQMAHLCRSLQMVLKSLCASHTADIFGLCVSHPILWSSGLSCVHCPHITILAILTSILVSQLVYSVLQRANSRLFSAHMSTWNLRMQPHATKVFLWVKKVGLSQGCLHGWR